MITNIYHTPCGIIYLDGMAIINNLITTDFVIYPEFRKVTLNHIGEVDWRLVFST